MMTAMKSLLRRIILAVAPSRNEIVALAKRETDPRFVREFEPITKGPVLAFLIFAWIGIGTLLVLPFRLIGSLFRSGE